MAKSQQDQPGRASSSSPEGSRPGADDSKTDAMRISTRIPLAFRSLTPGDRDLIDCMKQNGIPLTRESYILNAWTDKDPNFPLDAGENAVSRAFWKRNLQPLKKRGIHGD